MEGALGGIAQGHIARGARGGRSGAEIGLNGSVLASVANLERRSWLFLAYPTLPTPGGSGGALRGPPRAGGSGPGARAVR